MRGGEFFQIYKSNQTIKKSASPLKSVIASNFLLKNRCKVEKQEVFSDFAYLNKWKSLIIQSVYQFSLVHI